MTTFDNKTHTSATTVQIDHMIFLPEVEDQGSARFSAGYAVVVDFVDFDGASDSRIHIVTEAGKWRADKLCPGNARVRIPSFS